MELKFDKRVRMISATVLIVTAIVASLVTLTLTLRQPLPPNGGSPPALPPPQRRDERSVRQHVGQDGWEGERWVGEREGEKKGRMNVQSEYRTYRFAAVTTDTSICSKVGTDILGRQVGSAVDAAIATFLCVCVVLPHSCGIGGGHLATLYESPLGAPKLMTAVMSRERAPLAAHRDMFVNGSASSTFGGMAVAVPGEVSGFYNAHRIYGRMPWRDLFRETIRLCEDGFVVEPDLASAIRQNNNIIRADPNLAELFVKEDGSLIEAGDLLVNPKLAVTMRRVADDPLSFYTGSLAADIVADLQEYGSNITLEDLAQYRTTLKVPLQMSLENGDYTLYNPPPPSSGVMIDFIMNVLDGYNFTPDNIANSAAKTLSYHRIIESFKFAHAKRSELGDEDFVDVSELVANMTSRDYCRWIREQIDDERTHDIDYYGPSFDLTPDHGTAHISVLAPDGAAVSLTGTVNLFFGAKVRGRRTGIIFNNIMDDFSTPGTRNSFGVPASPSNYIVPGKMPMSSMSPTIVRDRAGNVVLLTGAAGGTRIPVAASQIAVNSLWFGLDLLNSSDTARVHHQLVPNEFTYENWLDPEVLGGLRAKNHSSTTSTGIAVTGSIRSVCANSHAPAALQGQPVQGQPVQGQPVQGQQVQGQPVQGGQTRSWCIEALSDGRRGGFPDGF